MFNIDQINFESGITIIINYFSQIRISSNKLSFSSLINNFFLIGLSFENQTLLIKAFVLFNTSLSEGVSTNLSVSISKFKSSKCLNLSTEPMN